ncbi:MAG: rhodanese-like domain-containing protein [Chloroflexota bacterium]
MRDEQPLKPANILNIVAINQGKKPLTMSTPIARPLSVVETEKLIAEEGHVVVDCRSSASFGSGHIPGSFNVQLSGSEFEQRIGWVVSDSSPIILVADSADDAQKAIFKMAFIGLDQQVVGYLSGGIKGWMAGGKQLRTVGQMDVHTLNHRLMSNSLQVLDVRKEDEWSEGHIDGSHFMPYTSMADQPTQASQLATLSIPHPKDIAVVCAGGQRSSTAISLLLRDGYLSLYNVTGGMVAWKDAKLPMVNADGIACNI